MERVWKDIIKAAVIGFLVPAVLLTVVVLAEKPEANVPTQPETTGASSIPTQPSSGMQPTKPTAPEPTQEEKQTISVLVDGTVVQMELEEYVLGVVLAEVPSSFELEALKAQAVAARTAALYICESGRHHGSVCVSYGCCQAYISRESYFAIGGTQERMDKVQSAVQATAGQVMTYEGELVCAAYFSCSGGSTEDAVAVWGSEVPYLQAVDSPGEEFAAVFSDQFYFTPEQLQQKLCVTIPGAVDTWFGEVCYTGGGGVDTMMIGGVAYRGTTLRVLLGLRSTAFTVTVSENIICFETKGYGHRVGMSQYGAQAMALAGAGYETILTHYYQGAELSVYPLALESPDTD